MISNNIPPKNFPETLEPDMFFLRIMSSDITINIIRVLVVIVFVAIIGYWIYLEKKNKH